MGQICPHNQFEQKQNEIFLNYKKFSLLTQKRSYQQYQFGHQIQKCVIHLKLHKKGESAPSKTSNKYKQGNDKQQAIQNKRAIRVLMDEQGVNLINHGILQKQLKNAILEEQRKHKKIIIVEQPQCSRKVNIKDIYIVVIKSFMDAEALKSKITPNDDEQSQLPKKMDIQQTKKVRVIAYWPRIKVQEVSNLIVEARDN